MAAFVLPTAEVSSGRRDCMASKAWNTYSLALYRKSVLIPALELWKFGASCNCIALYNVQSTLANTFNLCFAGAFMHIKEDANLSNSPNQGHRGRKWQNHIPRFWLQIASSFHAATLSPLNYCWGRVWKLERTCEYWKQVRLSSWCKYFRRTRVIKVIKH